MVERRCIAGATGRAVLVLLLVSARDSGKRTLAASTYLGDQAPRTSDTAHGWIDFVDVEGDEVVSPFGFRLSSASLLHVAGQEGGLSQRPGAVLVFLNDSPFQCFISPFETEILTRRVRKKNGTDYRVLDVANSGDGLVGRVAGHHLGPGDHVLTLKLVHPGSVMYDVDRKQVWLEHPDDLQLMGIESEPRRVRARDMVPVPTSLHNAHLLRLDAALHDKECNRILDASKDAVREKWGYFVDYEAPRLHAADGQDLRIMHIFAEVPRDGYFVDLAAHHAVYHSNTYALEQELLWRGLCIEPVEEYWPGFDARNCSLVKAVVGQRDGEADILKSFLSSVSVQLRYRDANF